MLINKSTLPEFQERSTLLNGSPFWYLFCSKHNTSTETHINSLLLKSTVFTLCTASLPVPALCFWFLSGFLTSPFTHQPILKITVSWLRCFHEAASSVVWFLYFTCLSHSPSFFPCSHKTFDFCFPSVKSRFVFSCSGIFSSYLTLLSSLWSWTNLSSPQSTSTHLVFQELLSPSINSESQDINLTK